ncbi:hypothetical protein [Cellulomonas sp. URHB0016]
MRRVTLFATATATLLVTGVAVGAMLWPRDAPVDPGTWPVEQLVADPSVAMPHTLHADLTDCPGFTMTSPAPQYDRDLPGDDTYLVRLDREHFTLWVCFGPVEEGARRSVADHLGTEELQIGDGVQVSTNATLVEAPFGEVTRVDRAFGEGTPPRLTDWLVDHDGYTYAFGYLHPVDDARYFDEMEAIIASISFDQAPVPNA